MVVVIFLIFQDGLDASGKLGVEMLLIDLFEDLGLKLGLEVEPGVREKFMEFLAELWGIFVLKEID